MRTHRLVVGLDGSDAAARALQWAVRRAAQDDATVLVVTAWDPPRGASTPDLLDQRRSLDRMQRTAIATALLTTGARPAVAREIILADPVTALCHAGRAADLVVLGTGSTPLARRIAARRPTVPLRLVPAA